MCPTSNLPSQILRRMISPSTLLLTQIWRWSRIIREKESRRKRPLGPRSARNARRISLSPNGESTWDSSWWTPSGEKKSKKGKTDKTWLRLLKAMRSLKIWEDSRLRERTSTQMQWCPHPTLLKTNLMKAPQCRRLSGMDRLIQSQEPPPISQCFTNSSIRTYRKHWTKEEVLISAQWTNLTKLKFCLRMWKIFRTRLFRKTISSRSQWISK